MIPGKKLCAANCLVTWPGKYYSQLGKNQEEKCGKFVIMKSDTKQVINVS
jgi:hypothetical protein